MTLGDEIREARERARLTQPELAELVGVSEGTISNWERGKVRAPKNRLARVWEVLHAYRAPRPGRGLPPAADETFDPDAIVGHLTPEQMAAVAARLPDHIFADEIAHRLRRTTDPHLSVPSRTWSEEAIPSDPAAQAEKPSGSTGEQPA